MIGFSVCGLNRGKPVFVGSRGNCVMLISFAFL